MIDLSVIRDLVAIFSVTAGFTYYVFTVRNTPERVELTIQNLILTLLFGRSKPM